LTLAAGVAVAALLGPFVATPVSAQNADLEEPQAPTPSDELIDLVESFYFAASLANYEAAVAFGGDILARQPDPEALLVAFRTVHDRRDDPIVGLDERLNRFQEIEQIAEISGDIVALVNEGRRARATRRTFLREQVERLGDGAIAYRNAVTALRQSGEVAAPILLDYLNDPTEAALHPRIRQAIVELGLPLVNPLLAATETDDPNLKAEVIRALGELGYPEAIPYILEQVQKEGSQGQVGRAADIALRQLGYTGGSTAGTEYYELAQKFWLRQVPIEPDTRFGEANLWSWSQGNLNAVSVPPEIFDEVMAMRAAANTLALSRDGDGVGQRAQDEALALWLAANYRREIELPEGSIDASRPDTDPTAGYYGTQAGVNYLQRVLERAIAERNLPPANRYDSASVALGAIRSLREIVGDSTLTAGETPLTRAMRYPDRRVAIESAMAIAQALPTQSVANGEQVVPLLAEALNRTGEPTVVLAMADADELNSVAAELTSAGFRVEGARTASAAARQAEALPGVDVLIIDHQLGDPQVNQLRSLARGGKLAGAAKLFMTATDQSRFEDLKLDDATIATTTAREGASLINALNEAREQVGGLPLDEAGATAMATDAGQLLLDIGLGSSVFSLETAREQILVALDDERPEIRQLASQIVALLEGPEPQRALASLGGDDRASEDTRVAAYEGLSESAQRQGNLLDRAAVRTLQEVARSAESAVVRRAAAQAIGALDLPVTQARDLIIADTESAGAD
jgi:hypothetical protein